MDYSADLDANIPGYAYHNLAILDHTTIYCGESSGGTDGGTPDGGTPDGGTPDGGTPDSGTPDGGTPDDGTPDAGTPDAGTPDAGTPDEPADPCAPSTPMVSDTYDCCMPVDNTDDCWLAVWDDVFYDATAKKTYDPNPYPTEWPYTPVVLTTGYRSADNCLASTGSDGNAAKDCCLPVDNELSCWYDYWY